MRATGGAAASGAAASGSKPSAAAGAGGAPPAEAEVPSLESLLSGACGVGVGALSSVARAVAVKRPAEALGRDGVEDECAVVGDNALRSSMVPPQLRAANVSTEDVRYEVPA